MSSILSEAEKKIQYYLVNTDITNMSADKIADHLYVSRSSIYRVCKKMGYDSFSHFKFMHTHGKALPLHDVNSQDIFEYVDDTEMATIISELHTASTVYVFGMFATTIAVNFLVRQLGNLGISAIAIEDIFELHARTKHIKKGDMVICMSNSGELSEEIYQILKTTGACIVGLTKQQSELAKNCDYSITFDFTMYKGNDSFDRENIFNLILIAQKLLVNIKGN